MSPRKPDLTYSDEEIARRRDDVILRMANTPPQPHKPLGKSKRKVGAKAIRPGKGARPKKEPRG